MTKKQKIVVSIIILIAIVAIVICLILLNRNPSLGQAGSQAANAAEVEAVVNEISKVILLPTGETPTIATVSDPEPLKVQPFFTNAQKDDVVLLYAGAKKAILWRPSTKKIIEVSPLNIPTETETAPTPEDN
jgi:hypothetical protein